MLNRRKLMLTTLAVTLSICLSAQAAWWPFSKGDDLADGRPEPMELAWADLIPDDFVQPENPFVSMPAEEMDRLMDGSPESAEELARLQASFNIAPVVSELDGVRVMIPAYITPLEYDEDLSLTEFLLVPYVGACIHTPPPPANQIVYAQSAKAIKFKNMYDPVWVAGTITTEVVKSELAESGYRLEVEAVWPYSQR